MLRNFLLLMLITTPLCAGGGAIQDNPVARPSIEELAKGCLYKLRQRKIAQDQRKADNAKKKQDKKNQARPVPGNNPPAPGHLAQVPEEEHSPQKEPLEVPKEPQAAAPQPTPGIPQASRGNGSLLGLAAVGFMAVCYNGYQNYHHKRPPHNILKENSLSKAHRPIFTQQ